MYVKSFLFIVVTCLTIQWTTPEALAQPVNQENSGAQTSGTRTKLATIIFAGLGGAILGLSTLSFYGRPQDKLNNISIGFAVGVIVGTLYTTYQTATQPMDEYNYQGSLVPELEFQEMKVTQIDVTPKYQVGYQWTF